jgi:hypothetical protein
MPSFGSPLTMVSFPGIVKVELYVRIVGICLVFSPALATIVNLLFLQASLECEGVCDLSVASALVRQEQASNEARTTKSTWTFQDFPAS